MKYPIFILFLIVVLLSSVSFPVLASDVEGSVATDPVAEPDTSTLDTTSIVDTTVPEDRELLQQLVELQALESGILVFLVVVVFFYFGYKFFRMFF